MDQKAWVCWVASCYSNMHAKMFVCFEVEEYVSSDNSPNPSNDWFLKGSRGEENKTSNHDKKTIPNGLPYSLTPRGPGLYRMSVSWCSYSSGFPVTRKNQQSP